MPIRFRKSIRLAPGIRLNLSKSGPSSISVGGKGLTYNIGKKGTRKTIGLPGSGLSYSDYDRHQQPESIDPETGEITPERSGPPWLMIAVIAAFVFAVYFFHTQG